MEEAVHKAGFVNIIGLPNVGKSTLTNALLGSALCITNHKPQTTRHRIHAILNGEGFQMVFSDTPGFIKDPDYELHRSMNKAAMSVTEDADVLLLVQDLTLDHETTSDLFNDVLSKAKVPVYLVLTKSDLVSQEKVLTEIQRWAETKQIDEIIPVSALKSFNVDRLLQLLINRLPESPPYYSDEFISDRSERFFIEEIIRNEILALYNKEVPYSAQVVITEFKSQNEQRRKTLIRAVIFVLRDSQKQIVIGRQGQSIKSLGARSRKAIEKFLGEEVFLDLTVKTRGGWRDDEKQLKKLGYN